MRRRAHHLRNGFTIIELMVVMVVLGILSSIAILKYIDIRNSAHAARVAADFNAIKIATYAYYTDDYKWPAEVGPGIVPPELVPVMNAGTTFIKDVYTLDYDYFPIAGSGPGSYIVGVTVTTSDPKLMTKLEQLLGRNMPFLASGGSL
ncbi:MAG TPA: type II secretion system protein, partial [Gemmatimonadales bacterium]|nr:type II secretion system protein [Gemmatimonadales bacterium]